MAVTSISLTLRIFYCEITHCLAAAAHECIPQWKAGVEKHWWTTELSDLSSCALNRLIFGGHTAAQGLV